MGHYTGTKAAGEGAVRAMARVLSLPTVICRMDVQYGTWRQGLERIVEFWEPRIRAGRYPS
jgi:nucleoside-diphosphate-sugar epimerase